ncbi:MAG: hypothetical protein P4L22_01635 [Candidatus Babeliales bacterium]|nr:hypothetical protein [Candidatus Babeliales bacterium]
MSMLKMIDPKKILLLVLFIPTLIISSEYLYTGKNIPEKVFLNLLDQVLIGKTAFKSKQEALENNISFDENNTFERKEIVVIPSDGKYIYVIITGSMPAPPGLPYTIGWVTQDHNKKFHAFESRIIGKLLNNSKEALLEIALSAYK